LSNSFIFSPSIYYVIFGGSGRRQAAAAQQQQADGGANNENGEQAATQQQQRPQGFIAVSTRMIYLFFASMNPSWRPSNWQNFVIPGEENEDGDE